MLFLSYTNISPSFILILNSIQEKEQKTYVLICNNVYDDIINFEVCGFMENTIIQISISFNQFIILIVKLLSSFSYLVDIYF